MNSISEHPFNHQFSATLNAITPRIKTLSLYKPKSRPTQPKLSDLSQCHQQIPLLSFNNNDLLTQNNNHSPVSNNHLSFNQKISQTIKSKLKKIKQSPLIDQPILTRRNDTKLVELKQIQKQLEIMDLKIKQMAYQTHQIQKQFQQNCQKSTETHQENLGYFPPQRITLSYKNINSTQNCPQSHMEIHQSKYMNSLKLFEQKISNKRQNRRELQINNQKQKSTVKTQPAQYQSKLKEKKKKKVLMKQQFEFGKKLGKGQFGEVWLVKHKQTNFICALKIINKSEIRQHHLESQIARQLSIQFYLSHPNIIQLYGFFQDSLYFYLLMEFSSHGSLLNKLKQSFRLQESQATHIIKDVSSGVNFFHSRNVIHRDIKPQNIMLTYQVAKITDFGWSVHKGEGLRKTASGSPLYYSPEIVLGNYYDQKIDIWDIGLMTYQCLIGITPFKIYSQSDLIKIVSQKINFPSYIDLSDISKDFILRALQKDPQKRISTSQLIKHNFLNLNQVSIDVSIFSDQKLKCLL